MNRTWDSNMNLVISVSKLSLYFICYLLLVIRESVMKLTFSYMYIS